MLENNSLVSEYVRTEVGVIPKQWKVKTFNDLFDFSGGFTASRDQLSNNGFCYLHYGDIHMADKTYIDVENEYLDIPKLNVQLKKISRSSLLNDGDVVFVDASEDDEGVSKHIVVRNGKGIKYISGLHTIVAKSKGNELDNLYKQFCFKTNNIKKQFKFYAVGTKVSGISKTNVKKILIPVPDINEQKAIATALSDMDDLILSIEKLISKKKFIKEGAMKELLTGKKRLGNYRDRWIELKIGDVFDISAGGDLIKEDFSSYKTHKCKFKIYSNGIANKGLYGYTSNPRYQENCITVTARGTIGYAIYRQEPFDAIIRVIVLKPKSNVNCYFVSQYINNIIDFKVESTGVPQLTAPQISKYTIMMPTYEEQELIATILSDMDEEIEKLEKQLDKYKNIKSGMMEELLTGKRRLV